MERFSYNYRDLGRRYDFTVDEKKFPYVGYIIDELVKRHNKKLSTVVCVALTDYILRNGLLDKQLHGGKLTRQQLEMAFEQVLPSIGEPLSTFDYDKNRGLYYFMTNELLTHSKHVGHSLVDGVDKRRIAMKEDNEQTYMEYVPRYVAEQAYRKQRSVYEIRKQRIAELQAELARLTEQEQYEKKQEAPNQPAVIDKVVDS
jgi:uncharacterized small protein (DUF1192 family)